MQHHSINPINTLAYSDLLNAVRQNDASKVSDLVKRFDPKTNSSKALRLAAELGHVECLRVLLPLSEPKAKNSNALMLAAQQGHLECVELLLPSSNAMARDGRAFASAVVAGHAGVVSKLLEHEPALLHLERNLLLAVMISDHVEVWRVLLNELAPQHTPKMIGDFVMMCCRKPAMFKAVLDQHPNFDITADMMFSLLVEAAAPSSIDLAFGKMSDAAISRTHEMCLANPALPEISAHHFLLLSRAKQDHDMLTQSVVGSVPLVSAPKSKI